MPYLTPETDSEDTVCFSITVPDTQGFRIVAAGLIETLYQYHNWEEFGLSRTETIERLKELNPLYYGGCLEMSCEQVADCVDTDETVQNSINTVIINNGLVNPDSIDPDNTTGADRVPESATASVAPPPPACDKDSLWAGIREMVDRVDQNGRDILEDLQFLNDKVEQWSELIDLVPLLGDTIKDISDLFTQQIPDILNAYNAASSPTFLDNVACDLFEMVCDECRYPTFDEIVNYFGSLSYVAMPAFSVLTYGNMWNLVKAVSTAIPEPLWYTVNLWQCFTLAIDGTFKRSYGSKSFEIWASFGEDTPNDNWEILCDGCEDVNCVEYDFTVSDHGFTVWTTGNRPFGVYVPGIGWQCTWNSVSGPGFDNRIYIEKINMAAQFEMTDVEMDYIAPNGGVDRAAVFLLTIGTNNQFATVLAPDPYPITAVEDQIATLHEDIGDGMRVAITTDTTSVQQDAFTITKIRIYYLEPTPPEGGNPC